MPWSGTEALAAAYPNALARVVGEHELLSSFPVDFRKIVRMRRALVAGTVNRCGRDRWCHDDGGSTSGAATCAEVP